MSQCYTRGMKEAPFTFGSDTWPGLAKLIEECGEVLQIAGKLITTNGENNYWDDRDLHKDLAEELGDLVAATSFVITYSGLDDDEVFERADMKMVLFEEWHKNGDDPR